MNPDTLVTYAFSVGASSRVQTAGAANTFPANLFQAENVSVDTGGAEPTERVACMTTLAHFVSQGYKYLVYANLDKTDDAFVVGLAGKGAFEWFYAAQSGAEAYRHTYTELGVLGSDTRLCDVLVGPGMVVCTGKEHDASTVMQLGVHRFLKEVTVTKSTLCLHHNFATVRVTNHHKDLLAFVATSCTVPGCNGNEGRLLRARSTAASGRPSPSSSSCESSRTRTSSGLRKKKTVHVVRPRTRLPPPMEDGGVHLDTLRLSTYYWGGKDAERPAFELEQGQVSVLAVASTDLWSESIVGNFSWPSHAFVSASDVGLRESRRQIPALQITIDKQWSVETLGKMLDRQLWGNVAKNTFKDRTKAGGCWGLLCQMPGTSLEIVLAMPYRAEKRLRHGVEVQVAFREQDTEDAKFVLLGDRARPEDLPCTFLGFHVPKARVTVFRFKQSSSVDQKWLLRLPHVRTLPPGVEQQTMVVEKPLPPVDDDGFDDQVIPEIRQPGTAFWDPDTWPFRQVDLSLVYEFHPVAPTKVIERRKTILDFQHHVLGRLGGDDDKPSYHLAALCCARLLQFLSPSYLEECNALADAWAQKHGDDDTLTAADVPSWGNFHMTFQAYDGKTTIDDVDMSTYVVKVPTMAQWEGMDVPSRLRFLARLLGFPVFYVNWVRSRGTTKALRQRDYHALMEHMAPRLPLMRNAKWVGAEDVRNRRHQTRSYRDLTLYAAKLFQNLVACVVGKDAFVQHVIRDLPFDESLDNLTSSLQTLTKSLAMLYPAYTIFPLLQFHRRVEECREDLALAARPAAVAGQTRAGKSTLASALTMLLQKPLGPSSQDMDDNDHAADADAFFQKFVDLINSMVPTRRQVSPAILREEIVKYGATCDTDAQRLHAHHVDILFGEKQASTQTLTALTRMLSFGNELGTTSHATTIVHTRDVFPSNCLKIHLRTKEELEVLGESNPDLVRWMAQAPDQVLGILGKTLTLTLPGGFSTDFGRRGQMEGVLNLIHGVQHGDSPLGDTYKLRFPGCVKCIELAVPMRTILPAFEDFIGLGETDRTLRNSADDHKVWIVPFTGIDAHLDEALEDALGTSCSSQRQVVAVYNYAKNPSGQSLKPPTVMAQLSHKNLGVLESVQDTYQAYVGSQLQVVAFDAVSCAAMVYFLKQKCVPVGHLKTLPMAFQASGIDQFLYATHHARVQGAMDMVAHYGRIQDAANAVSWIDHRRPSSSSSCHPAFVQAITALPSTEIAQEILDAVFRGKGQGTAASRTVAASLFSLVPFCLTKIWDTMTTYDAKAEQIVAREVDTLEFANVATRTFAERPVPNLYTMVLILTGDVKTQGSLRDDCHDLYADFMRDLTMECLEERPLPPYETMANTLKKMAMDVGKGFLSKCCDHLRRAHEIIVDIHMADDDQDAAAPSRNAMVDLLHASIDIRSITIHGQAVSGTRLADHVALLKEMATYVMYRVVEQMGMSTLKVGTFLEPTADMITRTLLHACLGTPQKTAQAMVKMNTKDASSDHNAGYMVALMRNHLIRSFVGFTVGSSVHFLQGDHHPGRFVTQNLARHADDWQHVIDHVKLMTPTVLNEAFDAVREACMSPELVLQVSDIAQAILTCWGTPGQHPMSFSTYKTPHDMASFQDWAAVLQRQCCRRPRHVPPHTSSILEMIGETIHDRRGFAGIQPVTFPTLRHAIGHLLGLNGTAGLCTTQGDFVASLRQKMDRDHPLKEFQEDYLLDQTPDNAAHLYTRYQEKHGIDVGDMVRSMGMSIAQILPQQLAYLCPGGRHASQRYLPTATTSDHRLTPQACFQALRSGSIAGADMMSPDLLMHIGACAATTTLPEVRQKLDTYVSQGEDLVCCMAFELLWTAITNKRAVSVMVFQEDAEGKPGNVQEYTWKPELLVRPPDDCDEWLREADDVFVRNMADTCVNFCTEEEPPLDVIVVYDGTFYVYSGGAANETMADPQGGQQRVKRNMMQQEEQGEPKRNRVEEEHYEIDISADVWEELGF